MSVSEAFALLLTDELPEGETQLSTRPTKVNTSLGSVLLGVDRGGKRHLLVPIADGSETTDRISRGITLGSRDLVVDGRVQRYADLACDIPRLAQVFERLVEDLVDRLNGASIPMPVVAKVLEEWRALIQKALADISRDAVIGIVGELEVLRELTQRTDRAIRTWTGPGGSVHDFVSSGSAIEVKATASVDAAVVRISNLDQLDPSTVGELHLCVVHLRESPDAPSIDDRVEELIEAGVPAIELEHGLGLLGYVRGMSDAIGTRYEVRSLRWWRVGDEFPGLRSSDVTPERLRAVGRVSYDLMLAGAPVPLPPNEADRLLERWTKS